ncbi:PEFG-CTERM sorting domain-containing protein [Candidatus Nitrosopumilus sp. SW]|uniref:PEFG-CTERM sorting domain-containing protein n=1 Tax=Candidatus Nitrosopumilus sp. SW TaxID=2508726 RepID=UPI00114F7FCB|nr:PEFG-CTERM sorting domain-containing protein [Candidatus Nitrosopumilus sp. SW]QDI89678.1 PEFG-CTERM sorting domain-containing protein [Candidatus Nitrosopumilus sp. SW]
MSSAYADEIPQACVGCTMDDARATANKMLLGDIPISVWTDKTSYKQGDMIRVNGQVANVASGFPVTITVVSPLNSIIAVDQFAVANDGSFETTINTSGNMWKYDGTYTIKANYGSADKKNSVKVELTGGVAYKPTYETPTTSKQCGSNEITANGHCVPFSISGGSITSATLNTDDNSIVINISATNDGTLTVTPSKTVQDGIFMVLVDGEEWDDVEIVANKVTVMFPAGTEQIEIIGTFVVPEFGTIAAMILAVAIISIIAVSAKSRLSIMPRY